MKMKRIISAVVFIAFLVGVAAMFVLLPKEAVSTHEKRVLATFPELELKTIADGSYGRRLETYLSDHFPFRQFWVGIHSYTQLLAGGNGLSGIYQAGDGRLIAAPDAFNEEQAIRNISRFRQFAEQTGLPAAILPVPSAGFVMEDLLPENHQQYWDERLFEVLAEQAGDLKIIDLRERFLSMEERLELYYRTDHHLTSAGSFAMYEAVCQAMDLESKAFSLKETVDGFYGTGYSRSGLWLTEPDRVELWTADAPGDYTVTVYEGAKEETFDSLYFRAHLDAADKYPVFLDGNHSLVTIENAACQNGRRLLLIKDSYAHCFATFAAENYEQICMVDLRYYRGDVKALKEEMGSTEILYLYGVENLASSTDIGWLLP